MMQHPGQNHWWRPHLENPNASLSKGPLCTLHLNIQNLFQRANRWIGNQISNSTSQFVLFVDICPRWVLSLGFRLILNSTSLLCLQVHTGCQKLQDFGPCNRVNVHSGFTISSSLFFSLGLSTLLSSHSISTLSLYHLMISVNAVFQLLGPLENFNSIIKWIGFRLNPFLQLDPPSQPKQGTSKVIALYPHI